MDRPHDYQHGHEHVHSPWYDHQLHAHSHHGTPAQEYMDFNWALTSPANLDRSVAMPFPPTTDANELFDVKSVQPPFWPSQLLPAPPTTFQIPLHHQERMMQHDAYNAPFMLPPPPQTSNSNQRRTLTNEDRREMCKFAEDNPHLKQTEIGTHFKVDRSTVSKVLRQKDKLLARDVPGRPGIKRQKSQKTEVERAMSTWAIKRKQKGISLTDEAIRERAARFAAASGGDHSNPATSAKWVEKFRRQHSHSGGSVRSTTEDPESDPGSCNASNASKSPASGLSPAAADLNAVRLEGDQGSDRSLSISESPYHNHSRSIDGTFPAAMSYFATPVTSSGEAQYADVASSPRTKDFGQHLAMTDGNAQEAVPLGMFDSPMNTYSQPVSYTTDHFLADSALPPMTTSHSIASQTSPSLQGVGHATIGSPSQADARVGLETAIDYFRRNEKDLLGFEEIALLGTALEKLRKQ